MPKRDSINHTSAWVFSCKFAASFQNTFLTEHLWRAASDRMSGALHYVNCVESNHTL